MRRAAIVYRHHVEGESLEFVAGALEISSRTARREVRRAFLELRELLEVS
jgi:DNA-directed RNA polymerase specialized sigma24 family protein